jgi:hypothetical protein
VDWRQGQPPPSWGFCFHFAAACQGWGEKAGAPPRRAVGRRSGRAAAATHRSEGKPRTGHGAGTSTPPGNAGLRQEGKKPRTSRGQGAGAEAATTNVNTYLAIARLFTEPATTPPSPHREHRSPFLSSFPWPLFPVLLLDVVARRHGFLLGEWPSRCRFAAPRRGKTPEPPVLLGAAVAVRGKRIGSGRRAVFVCAESVCVLAIAPCLLCRDVNVAVSRRGAHWLPGGRAGRTSWTRWV